MAEPTPEDWQGIIDALPQTLFLADLVFVADDDDERVDAVKDLLLQDDDDEIISLAFVGIDYQTDSPGVVLIPVSYHIIRSLIESFEEGK